MHVVFAPLNHQQDAFYYKISYEVKDKTAETNAVTWGNFANQLNTQFSNWQNNLIPTISNWESQAANYNNFYHQWKSNADTLRANAKTEYEASTAKIESDRSKWLLAMENQKKDADKEE
ncbi:MAG: TIGR04388 family protein [Leptospiraceae bacterium]|nr:TIGR04388 family protein [Leptospiraceae bacterium]